MKLEGANPTGSFKDRGMTVAVSAAVHEGAEAVICASTGNTAASAAAYAARGGLRGAVIVPEGKIATGKLAQALMHGARVVALRGNFDQALELVRALVDRHPIALVNSLNDYRIEGQKTAAFEVCDQLGEAPDVLFVQASVYVERDSQKGIVIGKGGRMLKEIGSRARADVEALLGSRVFLQLRVRVEPSWPRREGLLERFGY